MHRRDMLRGAVALGICACAKAPSFAANEVLASPGCLLSQTDFKTIAAEHAENGVSASGTPIIPRSGDRDFDAALAQALQSISTLFEISPGFGYYDDGRQFNAFATPLSRMANPDGTVLMGLGLRRKLLSSGEAPDVAVAAVCAHEFGHILQFKHNLIAIVNSGQQTVKRAELQADYFAGYFAGVKKAKRDTYPSAVFALTQNNYGDTNFGSSGHHGTPEERGNAVVMGFEAAFRRKKSISEAVEESTAYVLTL